MGLLVNFSLVSQYFTWANASHGSGRDCVPMALEGTKRMTPDSQTLFSITLFLALSSLLAWSNRRHRGTQADTSGAVKTV